MPEKLPSDYVSISSAAKMLGVSIDTVRRWDQQGILKSVRLDGKNRSFEKSELREFKRNRPLSISEAALALSVSISTLRRLEERGIILADRDSNGERMYSPQKIREYLAARKNQKSASGFDLFAPVKPISSFIPTQPAPVVIPKVELIDPPKAMPADRQGGGEVFPAKNELDTFQSADKTHFSFNTPKLPQMPKFSAPRFHIPEEFHTYKRPFAGLAVIIVLSLGVLAFTVLKDLHSEKKNTSDILSSEAFRRLAKLTPQERAELNGKGVLSATSANGVLTVNIRSQFNEDINGDNIDLNIGTGNLTAGNVIYSITAGEGIAITPGQTPTISSTGVSSIGGVGGAILLGSGLTISNNTLSSSANGITGLQVGSTTLNGSTITFAAGTGISLSASTSNNTITINGTSAPVVTNDWTLTGNSLYPNSTSYIVGIGTTTPTATLDVQGTFLVSGTTSLNGVTYTWPGTDAAAGGYVLSSDGAGGLAWIDASGGSANYFNQVAGVISPKNSTVDFLIGGSSTASAKFAVININSGTPTASISGGTGGAYLTATGNLATTNTQDLTLGGATSGNIIVSPRAGALGSYVAPSTNLQVDLGTPTSQFNNIYGSTFYSNGAAGVSTGTASCVTTAGGIVTGFGTCQLGSEQWVVANGTIYTGNPSLDLLLGGTSTTSARFAVLNVNSGTPTASLSGGLSGSLYITANGTLQTTANQNILLGGLTSGNITLSPLNGTGTVTSTGNITLSSGKVYQINGVDVLSSSTLGSGVTSSSLTTVGGLISGSIVSGFGTITTANTITGTTLNGTIGVNTGAGAGTQRIDATGNLVNIANISSTYLTTSLGSVNLSSGISLQSNGITVLDSSRNLQNIGTTQFNNLTYTWPGSQGAGYVLINDGSGVLSWIDPGAIPAINFWNSANGALFPKNSTQDVLFGGTATASAKFAFLNVNSGIPTASISGVTGSTYITADGTVATTANQNILIGGGTSGNITLSPLNGAGTVTSTGDINLSSGKVYRINGTPVLSSSTLESGVTSSSLTTVGNLVSGTIATGFGTIETANTITGTIINGTTGINTGATGGTQRIDVNGNLTNIGTTQFNTVTYTWPGADGSNGYVLSTSGTGTLSWSDPATLGINYFSVSNGAIYPTNTTLDFLIGGNSSASAKFGFLNVEGGTPTIQISGADVLTGTTLGSGVTSSSLTTVGGLVSGSIAPGFGTINTASTITGSTLNGTTGINTGAGAGTQRIDVSGNLVNIGTTQFAGQTYTWPAAGQVAGYALTTNGAGTLSWLDTTVFGSNYFTIASGAIYPTNTTLDFLIGAASSVSAKFGFINNISGAPAIQISGVSVLTGTTLGSGVTSSSLTTVGNLISGTIASGFGAITTANTITGSVLNGTTGINTGAGAGTPRIDVNGNLVNIGTTQFAGQTYTWPAGGQGAGYALTTDGAGTLSWASAGGLGTNYFTIASGAIYPTNTTLDFLIGGTSSAAAKFGFINNIAGVPAIQISGVDVLTGTTLGSGVTSSSLTTVGNLISGTIASGFGTITTANTITGTVLNGTTGINTGATAGTQRIDVNGNLTNIGTTQFAGQTYTWPAGGQGAGYALTTNGTGTLTWADVTSFGTNYFTIANGSIYPNNPTLDFLIGGNSSASAKFGFLNNNSGAPEIQISGVNVLTGTTLGSGVTSSSLTTVGNLVSGTIASGFGTITTGNTITGSVLNGTTGINTGATGGTQRIDVNGNLTNIGTTQFAGQTYTWPAAGQVAGYALTTNGSGTLSWADVTAFGTNYFTIASGAIYPSNTTLDFLVGGASSASAKFGFINNIAGTPSIQISGNTVLTGNTLGSGVTSSSLTTTGALVSGSIASGFGTITTANTITGTDINGTNGINTGAGAGTQRIDSSGNILNIGNFTSTGTTSFNGQIYTWPAGGQGAGYALTTNGSGTLSWADTTVFGTNYFSITNGSIYPTNTTLDFLIGGTSSASAKFGFINNIAGVPSIQISGTDVLTGSTLGSGVTSSSLTTVGNLVSGTIASGFGTITTANTITGTVLNGTTGINTGATGGTQRIDVNGNLTNIGTTQFAGQTYTWPAAGQVAGYALTTNGSGTLSWADTTAFGTNYFTIANGAIYPSNTTLDFLIGGTSSAAAKFGFINNIAGVPAIQIAGADVLTGTTLGSGVTSSSLTTVGGLVSGTIASGFGTISTTNTITGTVLNGTNSLNTGAGAGIVRVDSTGNLTNIGTTQLNSVIYTWPGSDGTTGYALTTNGAGTLAWTNPATFGTNYLTISNGAIYPTNTTLDFLIGGTSSASSKFGFINNIAGVPTIQISGADVLTGTTLGSGVTSSSLTTVGNLISGTIASGFGTITTGNTITGTILNGTTALNTGAGAGTQRIDVNGNLTNIGTTQFAGQIYTWPAAGQSAGYALTTNGSGTLSWANTTAFGTNYFTIASGAIYPTNTTLDFLVGASTTTSAKFAVLNIAGGIPTASLSAGTAGGAYLTANGTLQTTASQNLTIGGDSTGNINLLPGNGNGQVSINSSATSSLLALTIGSGNAFTANNLGQLTFNPSVSSTSANFTTSLGPIALGDSGAYVQTSQALSATTRSAGYASYNNYAYVIGGFTGSATANVYYAKLNPDGTTGAWTATSNLPGARFITNAVAYRGYLYALGGNDGANPSSAVYYTRINGDGTLDPWASTASLGSARQNGAAVASDGYIYYLGGGNGTTAQTTTYSSAINANGTLAGFSTSTALLPAREGGAAVAYKGYVYLAGGQDTTPTVLSSVHSATLTNGTIGSWTTTNAMPGARAALTGVLFNGRLFTTGGSTSVVAGGSQTSVYSAALNNGVTTWTTVSTSLPTALFRHMAAVGNGYMYVYGGSNSSGTLQTAVYSVPLQVTAFAFNTTRIYSQGNLLDLWNGNTSKFSIDYAGNITASAGALLKPISDATNAFGFANALGQSFVNFDSINSRVGIGTTVPGTTLDIQASSAVASISATTTGNGLVLGGDASIQSLRNNNLTLGGSTTGDIVLSPRNGSGGTVIINGTTTLGGQTYTWPAGGQGAGYALTTDGSGTLSWASAGGLGTNYFSIASGAIYPTNTTLDFLIGGSSSASAKFGFLNVNSGTPTASISGSTGATYVTAAGNLATTANQALTLGGITTGNIILNPFNGSGDTRINGTTTLGGQTYTWPAGGQGAGYALTTDGSGTLSWASAGGLGTNYFSISNGAIYPTNPSLDFLIGGNSTVSAKFAVLNVNSGVPTASLSANGASGAYLTAAGNLATTGNQGLTLGGLTTGNIILSPFNGAGDVRINGTTTLGGQTYTWPAGGQGAGYALTTDGAGTLSWASAGGLGTNYFSISNGAIYPTNPTLDFLVGGATSASAKFGFINTIAGVPTIQISGADVLTATTLGSGVTSSSLTTVGNLVSGTIATGFGTIETANTITGTIINGTTGINTGATGGTQRIDVNGNLTNIGTTQFNTVTYTWPGADGSNGYVLSTSGTGTLSWSDPATLGTNYFTIANGSIYPTNTTLDFLIGGTSSASAKFAFINVNSGTPTASISGNLTLSGGTRTIAATAMNNLQIGDANTGTLVLAPANTSQLGVTLDRVFSFGAADALTRSMLYVDANNTSDADNQTGSLQGIRNMGYYQPPSGTTYTDVKGFYSEVGNSGGTGGTITTATGFGAAMVATAGTVGSAIGFNVGTPFTNGGTGAITNAYGFKASNQGATGVGSAYGLHITVPTNATTNNIGIYVSGAPTGGSTTNVALQLADTGGTAAGGILFGTDTNLFRSAANVLSTGDSLTIGGNLVVTNPGTTSFGGLVYTWPTGGQVSGYALTTDGSGTLSWADTTSFGSNYFTIASGAIYPTNTTLDFLIGAASSASAKFALLNVAGGTPTASLSAGAAGGAYLSAAGLLQTTAFQNLTLGGLTTGDITLSPRNGSGTVTSTGDLVLAASKSLKITGGAGSYPSTPSEGQVYYRTDNKQLYVYENAKWQADRSTTTLIVAANDTQNKEKADYVADGAGGTDDATVIEAAIAALPSTGGAIVMLDGTFYLDSSLDIIKSNVSVTGLGKSTVLLRQFDESGGSLVSGIVTLGNASTAVDNVILQNIYLNGNRPTYNSANNHGILLKRNITNSKIIGLTIRSNAGEGIKFDTSSTNRIEYITINDNDIQQNTRSGILMGLYNSFIHIENNVLSKNGMSGFASGGASTTLASSSAILNNSVEQNSSHAIILDTAGGFTVTGNDVKNTASGGYGIYLVSSANNTIGSNNVYAGTYGIRVHTSSNSNTLVNNVVTGATGNGIWITGGTYNTITGNNTTSNAGDGIAVTTDSNTVSGNTSISNSQYGISLSGDFNNVNGNYVGLNAQNGIYVTGGSNLVASNKIYNNGASGSYSGINISGTGGDNNIISNNSIQDTAGIGFAISITASSSDTNLLTSNTFSGTGATTISDLGTGTKYTNQQINTNDDYAFLTTGKFGIGTTAPAAQLYVTRSTALTPTGKALAIFDQTENQDIFSASASGTTKFTVSNAGNVTLAGNLILSSSAATTTFGGIAYTWPTSGQSAGYALTTNGSGTLSWAAVAGGTNYFTSTNGLLYPINSTLDFAIGGTATTAAKFAVINVNSGVPTASLSANGASGAYLTAAGLLQSTGNQGLTLGGNTSGGLNLNTSGVFPQTYTSGVTTGTTTNSAFVFSPSALTTGTGLDLASTTITSGKLANIAPTFAGSGVTGYGLYIDAVDNTGNTNTDYGVYSNLALTGNAAKNAIGIASNLTTTSTTGDTLVGVDSTVTSSVGFSGINFKTLYGVRSQPTSAAGPTSGGGVLTAYGGYFAPNVTGSVHGTIEVMGLFTGGTATAANANATLNSYGLYVSNPTSSTTGVTTKYGIYLDAQTGADTNYGLCFDCDGTWTSNTTAAGIQFGTDANAVTLYRSASDMLKTDDSLTVGGNLVVTNPGTTSFGGQIYTWPTSGQVSGYALTTNGSGTLSWSAPASSSPFTITAGAINPFNTTVDFLIGGTTTASAKFAVLNVNSGVPTASLSASGASGAYLTAAGLLQSTGNQGLTIGGSTSGGLNLNTSGVFPQTFTSEVTTGTTTNSAFAFRPSSLTTGTGIDLASTTLTTGTLANITGTYAPTTGGTQNGINIAFTNNPTTTANTLKGVNIAVTDATTSINSNNIIEGLNASAALSGTYVNGQEPNKTARAAHLSISSSTVGIGSAENLYGLYVDGASTGSIASGTERTRSTYGVYSAPSSTMTLNHDTALNYMYGLYSVPSYSGTTSGYSATYGLYTSTANTTSSTTTNVQDQFGIYIADGSSTTNGISRKYGLYLAPQTGADSNYGICFDCDGTWSSSTVASGIQFGSDANSVNLFRNGSNVLQTDDSLTVGGNLVVTNPGTTSFGGQIYTWPTSGQVSGYALTTNGSGTLSWSAPASSSPFTITAGAINPFNTTVDFLIGGTTTASAKFAVLNVAGGTPTASLSGTTGGAYLTAAGNLATTGNQNLTIGGTTTGDIVLSPRNNAGKVLPGTDNTVSLGASSSARFKDLFLGPSSLHIQCTTGDGCPLTTDWGLGVNTTTGVLELKINNSNLATLSSAGALSLGRAGEVNGSLTFLSSGGATAPSISTDSSRNLNISAPSGQLVLNGTGDIVLDPSTSNLVANLSSTGDFLIQSAGTTFATFTDGHLVGIGTTTPNAPLHISAGTLGGNAALIVNQTGSSSNDLLTASASGTTRFTVSNAGNVTLAGNLVLSSNTATTSFGGVAYTWPTSATAGYVLQSGGTGGSSTLSWVDPGTFGTNYWGIASGVISPINSTLDFAIGGTASSTAKFAVLNVAGGVPTASISAGLGGAGSTYITAAGTLQTTSNQNLTIGGSTTGDITLSPLNGSGTVTSTGDINLASGKVYRINGASVLSASTLGPGVTSSGLTTVGNLVSGTIASGFGTITTGNTITGTSINGTTGINTGATLGTQRIDVNGNLTNIGTISSTYLTTSTNVVNLPSGVALQSNGTPVLDSSRNLLNIGTTQFNSVAYTWPGAATAGYVLQAQNTGASSTLTWVDPGEIPSVNFFAISNGALYPKNSTLDFLIGGTATASSKFAVLNMNNGTPTASISAGLGGAGSTFLTADGSLQTTSNQYLTIGGATTGNITLSPLNGSGTITHNGDTILAANKSLTLTSGTGTISQAYTGTSTALSLAANSVDTGTAFSATANGLTTGTGLNLSSSSNDYTTGNLFNATVTQAAATGTTVSGNVANIAFNPTYSTAVTNPGLSGNVLNVSRTTSSSAPFSTFLAVTGAVVSITDNDTHTTGTYVSTANVLSLAQNAGSSGDVFKILNTGTGYSIMLPQANNTTGGIAFGSDGNMVNLYRSANDMLKTDDSLTVGANLVVTSPGTTSFGGLTYTWPGSQGAGYVLQTNGSGTLSWLDPGTLPGVFTQGSGLIYPSNPTQDFAIGGNSTASAKFSVTGVNTNAVTVNVGVAGSTQGSVKIAGVTSGEVTITTAAAAGTWTMTLPTSGGTNGYALTTDGSGVTTWTDAGSATLTNQQTILARIGTTSDTCSPVGTCTTLFARLAEIDDTKIGTSADTGASSTLFGRIGANTDNAQCSMNAGITSGSCTNETLFGIVRNLGGSALLSQFSGDGNNGAIPASGALVPGIYQYTAGTVTGNLALTAGNTNGKSGLFLFVQGTLTVNSGGNISVAGFGSNGGNGSSGVAASVTSTGGFGGGPNGGNGGNGANSAASAGGTASPLNDSLGGAGGGGGGGATLHGGGAGGGAGGNGGNGGTIATAGTVGTATPGINQANFLANKLNLLRSYGAGGGGGGGGTNAGSSGGGGGGGGGGVIWIRTHAYTNNGSSNLNVNGGLGGNRGVVSAAAGSAGQNGQGQNGTFSGGGLGGAASTNNGGGGGGGAGGGVLYIEANAVSIASGGGFSAKGGNGGNGGNGTAATAAGNGGAGANGFVFVEIVP